jgi:hypothetical protein
MVESIGQLRCGSQWQCRLRLSRALPDRDQSVSGPGPCTHQTACVGFLSPVMSEAATIHLPTPSFPCSSSPESPQPPGQPLPARPTRLPATLSDMSLNARRQHASCHCRPCQLSLLPSVVPQHPTHGHTETEYSNGRFHTWKTAIQDRPTDSGKSQGNGFFLIGETGEMAAKEGSFLLGRYF